MVYLSVRLWLELSWVEVLAGCIFEAVPGLKRRVLSFFWLFLWLFACFRRLTLDEYS